MTMKGGELRATVLSVYDLPTRDQPSYVSVTACGATVTTGPPTSRHKDRNSFKFGTSNNTPELILKAQKLEHLYQSSFNVQVVYESKPWLNLTASYTMKQLTIHEMTWLVLTLEPSTKDTASSTASAVVQASTTDSATMEDVPPTIRIKVQLRGPYRPEVAAVLNLSATWFSLMDHVEHSCAQIGSATLDKVPTLPHKGLLLIPAVPAVTAAVVITPIVAGICVLFLPVFVPLLAAFVTVGVCVLGTGLVLYSSTPTGRTWIGGLLEPAASTLLNTPSGQSLLYETGPRPTPVTVARAILPPPRNMWARLGVSLFIDALGSASYLVPVVGEVTDLGWAPLQTILIMALYDTTTPHLKYVSFVEEILPFTDFVPSATIGWAVQFGPKLLPGGSSAAADGAPPTDVTVPASKKK
jgi:hypothetical protein